MATTCLRSRRRNPERAAMLRRYWVLHSQQDRIRRRLSNDSTWSASSTSSASSSGPLPVSPTTLLMHSRDSDMSVSPSSSSETSPVLQASPVANNPLPIALTKSRPAFPSQSPFIPPIPEHDVMAWARTRLASTSPPDEQLYQINHDIKSTLTDLLNCDGVRHDSRMRQWVQSRLMDAELELKRQRRRRVSAPVIVVSPAEDDGGRVSP